MALDLVEEKQQSTEQAAGPARPPENGRHGMALRLTVIGVVVLGAMIYYGIHTRTAAEARLSAATAEAAIPVVDVITPGPDAPAGALVLPGNTQAFTDSPIYARTSGYLNRWYADIGARVKKGTLLAEIDVPELDQQLRQARADLATAETNLSLADITSARNQALLTTHSVSTQERDNAVHAQAAAGSAVESNRANVARLEQLQSFEKIYAPFDGVITARTTDIGALVDAGANGQKALFHLGAIRKLRVYIAVPEVYSRAATSGLTAVLTLDEYPARTFSGTLVRNASAIDASSRTLLVEVDVDNPDGLLLPGAYVQVHLRLPAATRSVTIPANALLFRAEGLRVGVVRNDRAELVAITIGRDYGNALEVVSGLQTTDAVILDPSDSLSDGTPVRVRNRQVGGSAQ
jgi:RND family efflux transporter MFP subunit